MINSVPIIGLKGDNVMYTQTKSGGVRGAEDVWSIFGSIPDGVNINSSKAVHFFPYKGDFCMSIGEAVFYKKHRDDRDPEIKMAVDNWPKLYLDKWEKMGDHCLPTANACNVLPFARLSGKDIKFHLVVLTADGRLLALNGDLNGGDNAYTELKNASDESKAAAKALKIQQAAYWNGNIVALDDSNNTWNLNPDFDSHTFTAGDPMPVEPLLELTATDIGPVGVKKDGWIYRRRLETINDPTVKPDKKDLKVGWERWIQQNGVKNLGVASPGVMLNLEVLSRSLRDRYLSTQTSIYPVVNKLQGFTINHELFLQKQLEAAVEYQKNEDSASKQKIAIKEAKKLVRQTKIWASIMRGQANHTKTSVNMMGEELSSVRSQLDQQLIILKDKLVSLEAQIAALREAKSKMDAAFWGSIGVMLLGIGLAVLGVATGVGVIALGIIGGALFVGGLVAACYFGSQSAKIAEQISNLEAEMRGVNEAISDIKSIAERFGDLERMYGSLNQFWGRMFNSAQMLKDMNDATALQIGEEVLDDTSSIEASLDIVRKMKNGCATYLAVLNRHGIRIPTEESDSEDETADIGILPINLTIDPTFKTVQLFNQQVARAHQALANGQFAEYQKHLETADLIDVYTVQMGVAPEAISQVLNNASAAEGVEAADLLGELASIALSAVMEVTIGSSQAGLSNDIVSGTDSPAASNGEAADIFDGLASLARITPMGIAVGLVERAVSRDIDINLNVSVEPESTKSEDFLQQMSNFAKISPVGRVVGTIGKAAIHGMAGISTVKLPTNDQSVVSEADHIFEDLAEFARHTPFGLTVGLGDANVSHDVNSEPISSQTAQGEAADIFGVIADFTRFTPIATIASNLGAITSKVEPSRSTWFANPGIATSSTMLTNYVPFSTNHPSSCMLNGILTSARANVIDLLNKTLDLAATSESWMKQIPDIPNTDEELSRCTMFQGQALLSCKNAMEQARLANNAFVDFHNAAQDEQHRLNKAITLLQDKIKSIQAQGIHEIERAQGPQILDFVALGIGRAVAAIKVRQIRDRVNHEIADIEHKIGGQIQDLQQGDQFMGNSKTWVEFCELTSANLGSIYNTLTSVKYGIKIDPHAYKTLAATQWSQIRGSAEEVKTLLQPRRDVADTIAMDLDDRATETLSHDNGSSTSLARIASPTAPLLQQLRAQADNSNIIWENLGKLQRMYYTEDIVGYLDSASNRKVTLCEIISCIKSAYIQTAALHYETVEHISTLALLQSTRAKNLANGKISPHIFLKGTFSSLSMVRKKAGRVKAFMAGTSLEVTTKLQMVKTSIGVIRKAIAHANLDLARRDNAYRDKVTGMIVEGCLVGFATGGLVAAAAFAAYSGVAIASIPALIASGGVVFGGAKEETEGAKSSKEEDSKQKENGTNESARNAEDDSIEAENEGSESALEEASATKKPSHTAIPVQKRVEAAQDTWTALSGIMRSARDAASATQLGKALFNKMSLVELAALVQLVKAAVIVMERTAHTSEQLAKPLDDLLASVSDMADSLAEMDDQCSRFQVQAGGAPMNFGMKEAAAIKAQWDEISQACEVWLDIFNTQRISPLSFSTF